MTVNEVARIYDTNPRIIRALGKRGVIPIHRVNDGYGSNRLAQRKKSGHVYLWHSNVREYIDPEDLEVLEMLISELYDKRYLDWESATLREHNCEMDLEDYILSKLYTKSELSIILDVI